MNYKNNSNNFTYCNNNRFYIIKYKIFNLVFWGQTQKTLMFLGTDKKLSFFDYRKAISQNIIFQKKEGRKMNEKMYEIIKNKKGFIAALDQSGGSSSKTLKAYGIPESAYSTDEEMFDLIHEMRKRVFTSKSFTNEHIIGAILFEKTMLSKVNGEYTADYLWNEKNIVSFLKVDKGLAEQKDGVKLMKEIPELAKELEEAREKMFLEQK